MHESVEDAGLPEAERVERVAARLRLLADPTRLRVVCALAHGEADVTRLAQLAGAGLPSMSQHLSKLRLASVVRCRRQGQRMVYELVDAGVADFVDGLFRTSLADAVADPAVGGRPR